MQCKTFCCLKICTSHLTNSMAYFSFTDQPTRIYFPGTLPFTAPEFDDGLQPSWKYISLKKEEMDVQLPHISRSSTEKNLNGTEQWTQHNLQSCKMFDKCFDKILKASKDAISDTKLIFDSKNKNTQDSEVISGKAGLIESSKPLEDDVRKSHLGSEESRRKKLKNKAQRPGKKKMARHDNAWGGPTYTELITKAILSAPEQRLTLSQIYDWLAENVEYFRERSNYNSSQGWKNAIRHTLSLRQRFLRIPRVSAANTWYSSWWTVNPEHLGEST